MISVCIPAWERNEQLNRAVASIRNQSYKDWEICVGEHPVISTARNLAAVQATGDYLVFIDADVVLNPKALEHYANIFKANSDVVIVGMYHWLPPIQKVDEVKGIVGNDPRLEKDIFDSSKLRGDWALDFYSGNFGISKKLFDALEGFDEKMVGHGGEDAEFAIRLQKAGHKAIFSPEVVGFHIYHDRNQEKNEEEVMDNIKYIDQKHDLSELGIRRGKEGELPLVYDE